MKKLDIKEKINIILSTQCTKQDKEIQIYKLAEELRERWKYYNDCTLGNACFDFIHLSSSVMSYSTAKAAFKIYGEFMQLWNALNSLNSE